MVMVVRGNAVPRRGSKSRATPPIAAAVTTITITYVRSDALCNGGAIVLLT